MTVEVRSIMDRRGAVPDWSLRLLMAFACVAILAVLWTEGTPPGVLAILALVALSALLVPASPGAGVLGAGAAIVLAVYNDGDSAVRPAVLATVVLVHLLHVVTGLVAIIPRRSYIHLDALRRPALRFVGIQAVVFALAAVAWALPRGPTPVLIEVAALLGLTVVAVMALFLMRRT
jgi:hypothetical protein